MNTKSLKYGKIAVSFLLLFAMLTMAVSAALPGTVTVQWVNITSISCELSFGDTLDYATACIEARTGSTIEATMTLYRLSDGVASVAATWKGTGEDVLILDKPFNGSEGVTYYLKLSVKVTYGGYTESASATDTATAPVTP